MGGCSVDRRMFSSWLGSLLITLFCPDSDCLVGLLFAKSYPEGQGYACTILAPQLPEVSCLLESAHFSALDSPSPCICPRDTPVVHPRAAIQLDHKFSLDTVVSDFVLNSLNGLPLRVVTSSITPYLSFLPVCPIVLMTELWVFVLI